MKSLVAYYSLYGNTRSVAEAMSAALTAHGQSRAIALEALTPEELQDLDLFILGCPTHIANIPKAIRPLLSDLPRGCLKHTYTAAFDTSNEMPRWLTPFTAAKPLRGKLRWRGGRMIARPETFHVTGREGPMLEGETERAALWAETLLKKVKEKRRR